jgi:hypothetical protein
MNDYILLMHDDAPGPEDASAWDTYLDMLRGSGQFDG